MTRANRNLGSDNAQPGVPGFNPGGDDFGVVRIIDGHEPYATGLDGSNVHQATGGDPGWHDPIGVTVETD